MSLLEIRQYSAGYGGVDILRGLDLSVGTNECVAVLGANGAGKTTLLRGISGLLKNSGGQVLLQGKPLPGDPAATAALGIAHVPEGRGTIAGLTVEENLRVGGFLQRSRAELRRDIDQAYARFPILHVYRNRMATALSGGEQQMLAISRALMLRPCLLLLDEPSFGLAPKIVASVYESIRNVMAGEAISVLLVEQSAELAMKAASRAYILKHGEIVGEGNARELAASDHLRNAYLGGGEAHA